LSTLIEWPANLRGARPSPPSQGVRKKLFLADVCVAALSIAIYLVWIDHFRFRGTLADDDLYRMLRGLLDGACSGTRFASSLHYGKAFSFGYISATYSFVNSRILQDPHRLIALMNAVGFWSIAVGAVCFWTSLWLLYGARRATIAIALFIFSPILLEQGTSGHAILTAFAFFSAASILLFLPVRGFRAVVCAASGSVMLLVALTMRADIVLAFPFLVFAPANYRSTSLFVKSSLLRSLGPGLAFVGFFLLKHMYVDSAAQQGTNLHDFFGSYYKLSHIPTGIVICFLGCGIATVLVGIWSAIRIVGAARASSPRSERNLEFLRASTGPLSLILPALAFWIANPAPARHFFLCSAGIAILAALLISSIPLPRWIPSVYILTLGIVLANQALGALSGRVILHYYHFKIIAVAGQPRVMPHVPIGTSAGFHAAVQQEMWAGDAFAERIRGSCDARTIVVTDHYPQLTSQIYGWPGHWIAKEGRFHQSPTITATNGTRNIVFVSEHEEWPQDSAAQLLADPDFLDYRLVRDPDTLSIFDTAVIPPSRTVHFGCSHATI